jgi:hypothetical protein
MKLKTISFLVIEKTCYQIFILQVSKQLILSERFEKLIAHKSAVELL